VAPAWREVQPLSGMGVRACVWHSWSAARIQSTSRIGIVASPVPGAQLLGRLGIRVPPSLSTGLLLRLGRHGGLFGLRRRGISRKKLLRHDGAVKLADACPTGVLGRKVHHRDQRLHLDQPRLRAEVGRPVARRRDAAFGLRLFSVREPRSQNSWLHNVPKLMAADRGCRLRDPSGRCRRGRGTRRRHGHRRLALGLDRGRGPDHRRSRPRRRQPDPGVGSQGAMADRRCGGAGCNRLAPTAASEVDQVSGNAWFNGPAVRVAPRRIDATTRATRGRAPTT
jgi:hypothetical protein